MVFLPEVSALALAILFGSAFLAAAISAAAGFGGALLLLPMLVYAIGATAAVPVLTVAQLAGNLARVGLGFRVIRWRPVAIFLAGAVPLSVLGSLSFVALPRPLITRLIGAAILLFVILRSFGLLRLAPSPQLLLAGGGIVGLLSGLVGSAGPLGAAIFLSLNLPPVSYIASEASTALVMHVVKSVVYGRYLQLDQEFWLLGALLGVAMLLGTWAGKRIVEHMPVATFQRFVTVLLAIVALQLIVFGG